VKSALVSPRREIAPPARSNSLGYRPISILIRLDVRLRSNMRTDRRRTRLIKRDVLGLVGDVTGVLRDHLTPQTRMMLRKVLAGQIVAEPIKVGGRRCYRLRGHVTFASFLRGDVLEALKTGAQPDGGGPNGIRTRV